jgi:hypothetical protein
VPLQIYLLAALRPAKPAAERREQDVWRDAQRAGYPLGGPPNLPLRKRPRNSCYLRGIACSPSQNLAYYSMRRKAESLALLLESRYHTRATFFPQKRINE